MKSFSITNFKSFARKQQIPIKPITLIYGANSAGKSSILHSYLLLNNILKTGKCDVGSIDTPWDSLDIGGFKQYVYKQNHKSLVEFSFVSEQGLSKVEFKLNVGAETDEFGKMLNTPASIYTMEIIVEDQTLVKFTRVYGSTIKNQFKISYFNFENTRWQNMLEYISEKSPKTLNKNILNEELIRELTFDFDKFVSGHSKNNFNFNLCSDCFRGMEDDTKIPKYFIDLICDSFNDIWVPIWFDKPITMNRAINYIGPLRDYPPRVISDEQRSHNDKSHTWSILLENKDVREKVNKWLGNGKLMSPAYELKVTKKINPDSFLSPLIELFAEVDVNNGYVPEELESILQLEMDYDENGPSGYVISADSYDAKGVSSLIEKLLEKEEDLEAYSKLVLLDKRSNIFVSLRDVGVGISQVLPVLVNAYSPDTNVVAMEQPEIHLHPKLQSELADVFIETALGEEKKTFLIETHSEHLLLRIMRRIRETTNGELPDGATPITENDVQVLFVKPSENGEGSVLKTIALDEEGEMIDIWPGGFFEEGFNERFGRDI